MISSQVVLSCLLFLSLSTSSYRVSFAAPVDYDAGTDAWHVAAGDLNGDGVLDLVVANTGEVYGNSRVSVLMGNGDGTFQAPVSYPVGAFASWVAIADFNGDGRADVAVADYFGNAVDVLPGNGDGTLGAPLASATDSSPWSLAAGDLDGDGILDIAAGCITSLDSGTISILLGNGDGTFRKAPSLASPDGKPMEVLGADFNQDGRLDLATYDQRHEGTDAHIRVFLNNGDGTFRAENLSGLLEDPFNMVTGDLNGDGIPDLVIADGELFSLANVGIRTLAGDGSGAFSKGVEVSTHGYFIGWVQVGDFDRNGTLDAAVPTNEGVVILVGKGDGSFRHAGKFTANGEYGPTLAADLNGDGYPDLALLNKISDVITILLNLP